MARKRASGVPAGACAIDRTNALGEEELRGIVARLVRGGNMPAARFYFETWIRPRGRRDLMSEMTRSPRPTTSRDGDKPADELEAFARFCERVLSAEDGRPFALEPFQRAILADFFGGSRELVALLPKKNGKSSLLAALSLWHLISVAFAEVVVVAAARDQAGILLRQVVGFVRRSPALQERLKVVQREIRCDSLGGRIRVLASDVDTVDGQLVTLALIDELHRHRSSELYGILRDGLGPRGGQLVAISTAGDDEGSPLGQLRTKAHAMAGLERDGAHLQVRDDYLAYHEWALDPGADVDDLALVLTANPASWIDAGALRRRRTASMRAWQWRRFTCGIWSHGEDSAIGEKEWRACAQPGLEIPAAAAGVHVGVDLGWKRDCTALVPVWRPDGSEVVQVGAPVILTPPGDDTSLPVEDVFAELEQMAERWPGLTFVLDPLAGGEHLAQRLDAELPDATVSTHSQGHTAMCLASSRLSESVAEKRLTHPDDPELNRHVLAAAVRTIGEQWRFAKPRGRTAPIDALIALAMAHSTLVGTPPKPVYRFATFR
jgi:phage terminase large subunit-like protein